MGHPGKVDAQEHKVKIADAGDLVRAEHTGKHVRRGFDRVDDVVLNRKIVCHQVHAQCAVRKLHGFVDQFLWHTQDVLQRTVNNFDEAEKHQKVHSHGQAARRHGHARLLLELHQFLLLAVLVIGPFFLYLLHHGLICRHPGRALLLLDAEREHQYLREQREDDERPAVARDQLVDPFHNDAEKGCEET